MSYFTTARRRRRGVGIIYMLVIFTVLVGIVSFAVDYGRVRLVKSQLRDTVDAATRAGSSGLAVSPAEARIRAKAVASQSSVNNGPLTLLDSDIEMGTWNTTTRQFTLVTGASESSANSIRITGQLKAARGSAVPLVFLPVIGGRSSKELSVTSVGSQSSGAQDIVIVQDLSSSFFDEIATAKTGNRNLLDSQFTMGGTSSFGLVAFTGKGKTISALKNVSTNYSSLKTAVSSLAIGGSGMPPSGTGTDIAAGIEQAQLVFNAYVQASPTRSMVIVSDGESTQNSGGAHPSLSASQLLTLAQHDADTAWASGISVFVVFWDEANSATAAANLKKLIRGRGTFVHVTDPTKLAAAIGTVLTNTMLVK